MDLVSIYVSMRACVHVRNHTVCVCADMYGPILFLPGTRTNGGIHMHIIFASRRDQRWPTGGHFSCKKTPWCQTRPQPFLGHAFTNLIQTWLTDNE